MAGLLGEGRHRREQQGRGKQVGLGEHDVLSDVPGRSALGTMRRMAARLVSPAAASGYLWANHGRAAAMMAHRRDCVVATPASRPARHSRYYQSQNVPIVTQRTSMAAPPDPTSHRTSHGNAAWVDGRQQNARQTEVLGR